MRVEFTAVDGRKVSFLTHGIGCVSECMEQPGTTLIETISGKDFHVATPYAQVIQKIDAGTPRGT